MELKNVNLFKNELHVKIKNRIDLYMEIILFFYYNLYSLNMQIFISLKNINYISISSWTVSNTDVTSN